MEYIVQDFSTIADKKAGVFFYDEKIFLEYGEPEMNVLRSYLFELEVKPVPPKITKNNIRNYHDNGIVAEHICFVYTCKLADYLSQETLTIPWKKGSDEEKITITKLNCNQLVQDAYPQLLKTAIERLARKVGANVPTPVSLPNENAEFLEFTFDSASNWGGPFELDGKCGCGVKASHNTKKRAPEINIYDYSYWNCSPKVRKELDEIAKENGQKNGDGLLYNVWRGNDKKDYFLKLDISEQIIIARSYLSWRDKEYFEGLRPFKLYLFGNDDCSYSKWFNTKAEMDEELNYLRKMQPLDFNKDIKERNYIFTN